MIEILKQCQIRGDLLVLPDIQIPRPVYIKVKTALEFIGSYWQPNKKGFTISHPHLLEMLIANVERDVNYIKNAQFFETPIEIISDMIYMLGIQDDVSPILEPSAGRGAIVKKLNDFKVDCCETSDINREFLRLLDNTEIRCFDFMDLPINNKYNLIIANPPFAKNQDIIHTQKMYEHLNPNGCMVTLTSKHWEISSDKKSTQFKTWLATLHHDVESYPAGCFKESGTNIAVNLIRIYKE